ncbi:hypothetical protein [Rhizosaccharibacter radicis]|uniref:Uncharacterized protein n=1 Tax=Rhizosaccharibacter radicis TaxID=2782605 RepID=A0ABT1VYE3_9PROT|nr:hypothetical protein [Acetobacteraceae bacterium KSS12]
MRYGSRMLAATAVWLLPATIAMAQQAPPSSPYRDGTGNSEIERLNSSQLDQNYRGPYYQVPPRPVMPGTLRGAYPPAYRPVAPGYAPPAYGRPAYGVPASPGAVPPPVPPPY